MLGVLYNSPQVSLCLPRALKCQQEVKAQSQSARDHTQPKQGVKREVRPSRWLKALRAKSEDPSSIPRTHWIEGEACDRQ